MAAGGADGRDGGLDRRGFIAATAAAASAAGIAPRSAAVAQEPEAHAATGRLGSGGKPMGFEDLAWLARRRGDGYPVLFVDLAALDNNIEVVVDFAKDQGWSVRPALKSFRSPELIGYLLRRLPKPRGLVFNLAEIDGILTHAPRGTDLMTGYPPTVGALETYLSTRSTGAERGHRVRILIDSVPLMKELAGRSRKTRRELPLDVALELDVGMGRGGINDRDELEACLEIVREAPRRLRLGAVLGYDGHATLNGDSNYRKLVAVQAQKAYRDHLKNLADLGGDLYDERKLVRNGPGSSNYRNWTRGPINEISPGSAFLFARYLEEGYDTEGLEYALTMCCPVRRVTSDHPSVPTTGISPPGANEQEIIVHAVAPASEVVHPPGTREDELSGGGDALIVRKGSVDLGDFVLYRPHQTEVGIQQFDSMLAVREGRILRRWRVFRRPAARHWT